jgi:integrase
MVVEQKVNILKNGIRILRPYELEQLMAVIPKNENISKFEALLYTGCRYAELRWLYNNPKAFAGSSCHIPSMKKTAKHKDRYVRLNQHGSRAVSYFLRSKSNLPVYTGWDQNLKRWCQKAKIDSTGISCKTTRKTWESYLATVYPNNYNQIFLSQGHTDRVSLEYYMMLPFGPQDIEKIKYYTQGWI